MLYTKRLHSTVLSILNSDLLSVCSNFSQDNFRFRQDLECILDPSIFSWSPAVISIISSFLPPWTTWFIPITTPLTYSSLSGPWYLADYNSSCLSCPHSFNLKKWTWLKKNRTCVRDPVRDHAHVVSCVSLVHTFAPSPLDCCSAWPPSHFHSLSLDYCFWIMNLASFSLFKKAVSSDHANVFSYMRILQKIRGKWNWRVGCFGSQIFETHAHEESSSFMENACY